ncbi:FkbM family methyltransferase [Ancylobacter aquaticus]|uniref:FkbM family methyltransferase n=1 Tax=Ancylobacter aquaticus TaxID=100 RepID=A0A4R1I6V2_ANCAQ|nr:FkbM family methyltransferase [Ancylobacter aquaticus]TCK28429.1 FkbM family methyltransferase [Ancylobacter aquaticus]
MSYIKPALVCIATNGFQHLWMSCIDSHKRYADRYGFDYKLITTNEYPELTPHWSKVRVCINFLSEGHDVLLIDSDAYVRATTPRFTDLLRTDSEHDIFIVNGWSGRPNSGVVVFRGGKNCTALRFLEECLSNRNKEIPEEDKVTEYGENGHFIHFLKQDQFSTKTRILDDRWNKIKPPARPDDFIIHYTGPMRPRGGAMDGCDPFFGRTNTHHSTYFSDRIGREYYRIRWVIVKVANRIPILAKFINLIGRFLIRRADISLAGTAYSAPGAIWKCECALALLEHPTTLIVRQLLTPGDVVVDGGAHIGYLTRQFARAVGSTGRVIAIEAHPENAACLRSNVQSLPVTVVENAITQENQDVYLHTGGGHSNHSLVELPHIHTTSFAVQGRRLDDILSSLDVTSVDLLKLDIEGFEIDGLRSLGPYLSEGRIRYMLIEISPDIMKQRDIGVDAISSFLYEHGFILREIRDDHTIGPRGFVNTQATQNYIAANESGWTYLLNRINIYRK